MAAALNVGPRSAPPQALPLRDPPVSVSVLTLIEALIEKRMLRCAANLGLLRFQLVHPLSCYPITNQPHFFLW